MTVEPPEQSQSGSVKEVEGSYFAVVEDGSTEVGVDVTYKVMTPNGECHQVLRQYLRHRKWHRIAFLQVTNDKKHDCWSSQAFADKRLNFFDIFNKKGFDEAREFARNDRAEEQSQKMQHQHAAVISQSADADPDVAATTCIVNQAAVSKGPGARINQVTPTLSDALQHKLQQRCAQMKHEAFWAWLEESDNATHFKSKENLNFWSERSTREHCEFLRTVWVEFGCPGHGKGPWDGLGATAKTKVTKDITDGNERTPSGKITSPLEVAQHLRCVFDSEEWMSVHMDMKIHQVAVMYLDAEEIVRPESPPVVSVCKGILTSYSFLFLGTLRYYAIRRWS